jgi:thiol:disulfide interchange protein
MIPLGLGFVCLRNYLNGRPVKWVRYSAANLDRRLHEGRTALLVFGGDWDTTPLYYYQAAIETPRVHQWIRSHGVIPMRADWIKDRAEVSAALKALPHRQSIPVVAVYSASGDDPIVVVSGEITEERILEALGKAERRR